MESRLKDAPEAVEMLSRRYLKMSQQSKPRRFVPFHEQIHQRARCRLFQIHDHDEELRPRCASLDISLGQRNKRFRRSNVAKVQDTGEDKIKDKDGRK